MDRRRSSHIVPEIYEAAINPDHWDYVMAMIAKLTGSQSACLYYKNKDFGIANAIALYGVATAMSLQIDQYFDDLDFLFDQNSDSSAEPPFLIYYPDKNSLITEKSEIYTRWMKPNDINYVGGGHFLNTPTHNASFALLRNKVSGCWSDGEVRVIKEILPHLKRALNIHSEFTHLRIKQDALLRGLDRLVIGLILYDGHARVIYMNPTAKSIVEEHPALQLHGDHLLLANPEEDRNLKQTIIDTSNIDPDDSWKQSVAVGVTHRDCESPLPLLVTPIHARMIAPDLDHEGAKVAVFMSDPNLQHPISIDSLSAVYGLTPSEAQVSISLTNGHNIDQIAKSSNHSAHTIRSQLKSVFRKTGVSRQSELVKLLLTGPFAQRRRSTGH